MSFDAGEAEDIRLRIPTIDAYARLSRVWNDKIIPLGPPPNCRIGSFSLSGETASVWEVFAIVPRVKNAHFLVRSLVDKADVVDRPIFVLPALIVAMNTPKLYWVDVANWAGRFGRDALVRRCGEFVARTQGSHFVATGV